MESRAGGWGSWRVISTCNETLAVRTRNTLSVYRAGSRLAEYNSRYRGEELDHGGQADKEASQAEWAGYDLPSVYSQILSSYS